jgi:hypothetical protein
MATLGATLWRNKRAFAAAFVAGAVCFTVFNLALNPGTITRGFGWLFQIASHKGIYGNGEPGFIDFDIFWSNMATILLAAPFVSAIFAVAAVASLARMMRTKHYSDPVSVALLAACGVFAAQLVATSKHFALHYMMTSWVLAGGVLVLTIVQLRRLIPALSGRVLAAIASAVCAFLISTTLVEARRQAIEQTALDKTGARLSEAVVEAGPACANVSSMFVRAPENEMNHGYGMTMDGWGSQAMKDRFSDAYAHTFKTPLLDQNFYTGVLAWNFRPTTYAKLAAENPCIIVRSSVELDDKNAAGLTALNPDHCVIEGVHVYTVGMTCAKIQGGFSARASSSGVSVAPR